MTGDILIWLPVGGILAIICFVFVVQLKRCPSNRLLLIRNRLAQVLGWEPEIRTYHGGMFFVWPLLQEYRFLDLSPMKISVDLSNCTEQEVRNPSVYYFKACLDVDSDEERRYAGQHFWSRNREQIQQELKQKIEEVIQNEISSDDRSAVNEERNDFLVELERILNRELTDHGFRLLTISHKS